MKAGTTCSVLSNVHQKNEQGKLLVPSGGKFRGGLRALYPDLIYDDSHGKTHLFDVKYKRYDFKYGVKREDIFQIHTYLGQVSNNHDVIRCGLIYPIGANHQGETCISQSLIYQGKSIVFEVHFFKVPDENNENYKNAFNTSKQTFIRQLIKNEESLTS